MDVKNDINCIQIRCKVIFLVFCLEYTLIVKSNSWFVYLPLVIQSNNIHYNNHENSS